MKSPKSKKRPIINDGSGLFKFTEKRSSQTKPILASETIDVQEKLDKLENQLKLINAEIRILRGTQTLQVKITKKKKTYKPGDQTKLNIEKDRQKFVEEIQSLQRKRRKIQDQIAELKHTEKQKKLF